MSGVLERTLHQTGRDATRGCGRLLRKRCERPANPLKRRTVKGTIFLARDFRSYEQDRVLPKSTANLCVQSPATWKSTLCQNSIS